MMLTTKMDKTAIETRLKQEYPDAQVTVMDMTGTGDHWEVQLTTSCFKDLSRIKQHQKVMALFQKELDSGQIHALSLKTQSS